MNDFNHGRPHTVRRTWGVALLLAAGALASRADAQQPSKIEIGENAFLSVGGGIRSSFMFGDNGFADPSVVAGTGDNADVFDFNLDSVRLYTMGQINQWIYTEFNTELAGNSVDILDAIVKLSFSPKANIWIGRHLPPSDRSNLSGPYFLGHWRFPDLVQRYPAIFAGRDNGIQFWGRADFGEEGKGPALKYQIGVYEGYDNPGDKALDGDDNPLIAARLTLNLWDNEDGPTFNPHVGAYNMSTYYGTANVAAIGLTVQMQPDGVTNRVAAGAATSQVEDFLGFSVDFLFEKKIGDGGALTVEGAFYTYDFGFDQATFPNNAQGLSEGTGFFGLVGFLIPGKVGPGQLRPYVRFQSFTDDTVAPGAAGENPTSLDLGIEYVFTKDSPIFGHQARATLNISIDDDDDDATDDRFQVLLGMQVQF